MIIRREDLIGTYEQKRALVSQFNLMDDTFCSVVLEDKAACEYLLTALLGKPIKVIENKTQYSIRNLENHSIVLDALVEDEEHNLYDVEIQTEDEKNCERRMRYYCTAIDWSYLEKGKKYSELPELYMIFISNFDPFEENKNYYEIKQYVGNSNRPYCDGIHRLYFNTAVKDDSELSKLLQYLRKSDAGNTDFGALSQAVNYYKIRNEGVDNMCKAVEDYARELAKDYEKKLAKEYAEERAKLARENIENAVKNVKMMLDDGVSIEKALKYANIDLQTYEKYSGKLQ